MSFQDLLNTDMDFQSLGALARRGFGWWVDELAAMLPASWRARLTSQPTLLAERQPDGRWRFLRDGRVIDDERARRARAGVALVLPAEDVLVREVAFPRMSSSDIRRMVAMDIDRLSPLSSDLIHFDTEVTDAGDGKAARLGIVRRDAAWRLVEQAEVDGLVASALVAPPDDRAGFAHFDFLPAVREAQGAVPPGKVGRYWRWAVVALLVLNLAALIGRDMADIASLRRRVELRSPAATAVMELRRRVETEEARRKALVARGETGDPLRMLQVLTRALPDGAWVQHLDWNGQTLRILGFRGPGIDMEAVLRDSGEFINPHAMSAASGPPGAKGPEPFDITVQARRSGRP